MILHLEIITPQKVVFQDEVTEVTVPTVNGQITILPNHATLLAQLTSGELIIITKKQQQFLAVTGGFIEVDKNKVTVLADYAIRSEEIEIAKAEEAKKRAEKAITEKVSEEDLALAQGELRRSILELKIANRRRTHGTRNL